MRWPRRGKWRTSRDRQEGRSVSRTWVSLGEEELGVKDNSKVSGCLQPVWLRGVSRVRGLAWLVTVLALQAWEAGQGGAKGG